MKKHLILFIFVFLSKLSFGQSQVDTTRKSQKEQSINEATELRQKKINYIFLSKYKMNISKYSKELGLKAVQKNEGKFLIRIWTERQCFEIKLNGNGKVEGQLVNYAITVESEVIKTSNKLNVAMGRKIRLSEKLVKSIYSSFKKLHIDTIPSMENIPFWGHGQDGKVIIIEQFINGQYNFKFYWSPEFFAEDISSAKSLKEFGSNFYSDELTSIYKIFFKSLPIGCYYYGGMSINCRTKKR
ncbi:MAG: hypothetical protein IPJ31_01155 [Bacteroidetes bacterium]|nr:hypothetical protein [Bacteroidota bacterium]MBP6315258.1 hypothetical protein [Chitinophagaceae bacterium]